LRAILVLRGHEAMLDADLAALYEVETRVLVQAVKRNAERFPEDFMFQLAIKEVERLRSQIATIDRLWGTSGAPSRFACRSPLERPAVKTRNERDLDLENCAYHWHSPPNCADRTRAAAVRAAPALGGRQRTPAGTRRSRVRRPNWVSAIDDGLESPPP